MAENAKFAIGEKVTIDQYGSGRILKSVASTAGYIYEIHIVGLNYTESIHESRLSHQIEQPTTDSDESEPGTHTFQLNEPSASPINLYTEPVMKENQPPSHQTANSTSENLTTTRFGHTNISDDAGIEQYIMNQASKHTLSKTFNDNKLLKTFLDVHDENRPTHEIPPSELNRLLCQFFMDIRKPDGSNYEPGTLRGFLSSFNRQLIRKNYGHCLITSPLFSRTKEVLKAKQISLKKDGKGNKPNKAEPITDEEIEQLWQAKQLGPHSPETIINTLWLYNTICFGLRGSDEHRQMCWGDITLKVDGNSHEYLEFQERQSKTRPGSNPRDVRIVTPKMFANLEQPDRCPVQIYKQYAMKRPADFCEPSHPFYIATHTQQANMSASEQWFKRNAIGINKLTSTMKRMASAAGLSSTKKLSNHSARKHLIQKLSDNFIPANEIMQISGHKNIQSINNYSHLSHQKHKHIGNVLSNTTNANRNLQPQLDQLQPPLSAPSYSAYTAQPAPVHVSMPVPTHDLNYPGSVLNNSATVSRTFSLNSLFGGNIHGGTFNVNVYQAPQ